MPTPKTLTQYWPNDTDRYVVEYNTATDPDLREHLYVTYIHPPLLKLVEYTVNKYAREGEHRTTLRDDLMTHLILQLQKYHRGVGKSFSYFSVIAKHYMWQHNQKRQRDQVTQVSIHGITYLTTVQAEDYYTEYQDDTPKTYYKVPYPEELKVYPAVEERTTLTPDPFLHFLKNNPTCGLTKKRDLKILDGIRTIVKNLDEYDLYHKKSVLKDIRELTGCKTEHIRNTIVRIKRNYQNTL